MLASPRVEVGRGHGFGEGDRELCELLAAVGVADDRDAVAGRDDEAARRIDGHAVQAPAVLLTPEELSRPGVPPCERVVGRHGEYMLTVGSERRILHPVGVRPELEAARRIP